MTDTLFTSFVIIMTFSINNENNEDFIIDIIYYAVMIRDAPRPGNIVTTL